jgi:hypothetical protein
MTLAMTAQALLAITRAKLFAKPAASAEALAAFKKAAAFFPSAREGQRGGGAPLFHCSALGRGRPP